MSSGAIVFQVFIPAKLAFKGEIEKSLLIFFAAFNAALSSKSHLLQRLLEIPEHIHLVFQTDRNSHQTFIDSRGFSKLA